MLYSDSRGVSRVYAMSLQGATWRLWRNDPAFAQRFEATLSGDRNRITGRWEKRRPNGEWEHDFDITYSRTGRPPAG